MSIKNGECDYCGRDHLLETGDERSQIQLGKLWCGNCRDGSKDRYKDRSDSDLQWWVKQAEDMLRQHPPSWSEPYDHPWMHLFKLDKNDEAWRIKNELRFREE